MSTTRSRMSLSSPLPVSYLSLFNVATPTSLSPLSLHDALPIFPAAQLPPRPHLHGRLRGDAARADHRRSSDRGHRRSEEHTSELQSRGHLVCRLLLEKKKSERPVPWHGVPRE